MKTLILYNGIGTSIETALLHNLWNITEPEARDIIDVLWGYGLVQHTDTIIPPYNAIQRCAEVHAVISQYIIECMDSNEVLAVSPYTLNTFESVRIGSFEQFQKISGICDTLSLCSRDYLKYKLSEIESNLLPYFLKTINMMTITDPHKTIVLLQTAQDAMVTSPNITTFFPTLNDQFESLISDCHKLLKDAYKLSRKFNQNVQRCLTQKNYYNLIQTIETYVKKYPMTTVAQQAVEMIKTFIPYCDGELLDYIMKKYEALQMLTPDYNNITLMVLPYIKLYTKELELIHTSLQTGSPDIEAAQHYFLAGQHDEEYQLVETNYYIKLQEVAPNYIRRTSQ